MEGAGAALLGTGLRLELAPEVNMTLIEVNQRDKGRVKQKRKSEAAPLQSHSNSGAGWWRILVGIFWLPLCAVRGK